MKYIKKYFTIWWVPIVFYCLPILVYILGTRLKSDDIIDVALILFYLNILGNIISVIVHISIKKWYLIIPQLLITSFLIIYISVIFSFSPADYYGANKVIPNNVEFEELIEKELKETELGLNDFKIVSVSQPGIYRYYTNYKSKEKGCFYIKAFEITSNDRLSEAKILRSSKIIVDNLDSNFFTKEFTIYEGSWGDKYGARIELWFKTVSGNEFKVNQKNYIVEGWMR